MTCILDVRWCGEHGIGRFSREIADRLSAQNYQGDGLPMSPLDPIRLARTLRVSSVSNDWFLSPGYNAPLWGDVPYVMTIHDLNHIDRQDNSSLAKRIYYGLVLRRLCHRARAVLTVSEFSRDRISSWMQIDPCRIFNVGNGVSCIFSADGERWAHARDYVLCVSNRRGHKNESAVVAAFSAAALPASVQLVFTGEETEILRQQARSLGVGDRIVFTGRVSEETLAKIYRGASCLCFVSLYEGFGLPIVEAFASGIPVITSNVTSMPEIAGDAALLVDPTDIGEIAGALRRIQGDSGLRAELVARGMARVGNFTWDAVVDRVKAAIAAVDNNQTHRLHWS